MDEARHIIATDATLSKNLELIRSITGFGEVSATILLAELPNIADFTPKALARVPKVPRAQRVEGHRRGPSSACPLVSTAPARRCAGQARSAASGRNACAAHSTCAPSAPNGTIASRRLRRAHVRRGQAAQSHPDRCRPQAAGLCPRRDPHPKSIRLLSECPFTRLTRNTVSPPAFQRLRRRNPVLGISCQVAISDFLARLDPWFEPVLIMRQLPPHHLVSGSVECAKATRPSGLPMPSRARRRVTPAFAP